MTRKYCFGLVCFCLKQSKVTKSIAILALVAGGDLKYLWNFRPSGKGAKNHHRHRLLFVFGAIAKHLRRDLFEGTMMAGPCELHFQGTSSPFSTQAQAYVAGHGAKKG